MTVLGLDPCAIIEVGERVGVRHVSLILDAGPYRLPHKSFLEHPYLIAQTVSCLRSSPVRIHAAEGFLIDGEQGLDRHKRLLEIAARLSVERCVVMITDGDLSRATDDFDQLCDMAQPWGLSMSLEFVATTHVSSLADAVQIVRSCGCPSARVSVDILHLVRSGGSPEDLRVADIPFGAAQLCDGPLVLPRAQWDEEALRGRRQPGDGQFPIQAFLDALPDDLIVGLEVPMGIVDSVPAGVAIARHGIAAARRLTDRFA